MDPDDTPYNSASGFTSTLFRFSNVLAIGMNYKLAVDIEPLNRDHLKGIKHHQATQKTLAIQRADGACFIPILHSNLAVYIISRHKWCRIIEVPQRRKDSFARLNTFE